MIKLKNILFEAPETSFTAELIDFNKSSLTAGQMIFDYIRSHEKFVPFTYDDKAGYPPKPYDKSKGAPIGRLTIGYGTTNTQHAFPDNKITKLEAERISANDINEAAKCIRRWQSDAKAGDANQRKLTINMYRAMIDFVYNNGCSLSRNGKVFELIEQGEYKSAYVTIKNGEWGHPERRNTTAELFAKDGFPHKFINKHKTQFIGNFKTK